MQEKQILHYKILEKLGEGGMGVVYLAEDSRLERKVAIKFLPHDIADNSEERKRFEIEAKAAAALNHPNIATIYAIEEADDEMFLVMEYIDGQELKDILNTHHSSTPPFSSPLIKGGLRGVIQIATQIAEGLQAAHDKGIIHRDIKSSNIMVTDKGKVKIMDFGLAKMHGNPNITMVGSTIGTPYYMSPEQARGDEIDQRTDIWSFGVVLYEMVSGELPFKGDYEQAVIFNILNEQPPFEKLSSEIPQNIKRILQKCLHKNRDERYPSAKDILSDLTVPGDSAQTKPQTEINSPRPKSRFKQKYLLPAAAVLVIALVIIVFKPFFSDQEKIDSIAVLPLANLSGDESQEYIADGMTDALITQLSKLTALHVISRQSIILYKITTDPLKTIASKLAVDAIVEGSVTMAGERIRISANLIDASKEKHIWSEEYERDFKDILSLQKDVAKAVTNEISLQLTPQDELTLNESQQVDPEAYKLYLKGIQYYREFKWQKAMACFDSALAKDPDFGPAYAENLKIYCINGNPHSLEKAKNVADKLLNDYADLPEAQIALTVYYSFIEGRFDLAEQSIEKAIELNPGNSEAHREYGLLLSRMTGNYKKSLQEMKEAKKLDPLYPEIYTNIAEIYILQGQYEKAIQEIQTPKEINPDFEMNAAILGWIYVLQGNIDEGIKLLESRPSAYSSVIEMSARAMTGYAYAIQGKKKSALTYLNKSIEKENYKDAAFIYFGLNEIEEGLEYLQKAFDESLYSQKLFIAHVDSYPFWKTYKDDSRFENFVNIQRVRYDR